MGVKEISFADCLEIWKTQPPGTLRVCTGLYFCRYQWSRSQRRVSAATRLLGMRV